jgi:hypothetical protein
MGKTFSDDLKEKGQGVLPLFKKQTVIPLMGGIQN